MSVAYLGPVARVLHVARGRLLRRVVRLAEYGAPGALDAGELLVPACLVDLRLRAQVERRRDAELVQLGQSGVAHGRGVRPAVEDVLADGGENGAVAVDDRPAAHVAEVREAGDGHEGGWELRVHFVLTCVRLERIGIGGNWEYNVVLESRREQQGQEDETASKEIIP